MARKPSATVEYLKGKTWSILVRSSDGRLLADLVGALGAAERRGLQILNALPPFAGIESKPRKVRKPDLTPRFVGGISGESPPRTKGWPGRLGRRVDDGRDEDRMDG